MARKFLGLIAILTGLVIVGAFAWRIFAPDLMRYTFVPDHSFAESPKTAQPDYTKDAAWQARPGLVNNPSTSTPEGYSVGPKPAASVFFVTPTAWVSRTSWNAPLDDADTETRLERFVKTQASVFNGVADIWVPRYRQAAFGAFLKPGPDAVQALALAYLDVNRAFDAFLAAQPADRPIILAGHSQGALHILHLLKNRRAELGDRLVAVYAPGWSVALPDDLEALGVPACTQSDQAGCVLSWQSYAADGELEQAIATLATVPDLSGKALGERKLLCVNPLTGSSEAADAAKNAGMLNDKGELRPDAVGAQCNERGLLVISPTPKDAGPFVLPGGNFHVYDYALFWANLRSDVEARLSAFTAAHLPAGQPPVEVAQ